MSQGQLPAAGLHFTSQIHSEPYPAIDPNQNTNLVGRSVFITGAATPGGVGRATALAFAKAGASFIALGDIAPWQELDAELKQAATAADKPLPQVLLVDLDVTDRTQVHRAVELYKTKFGAQLDVLINNAAYLAPYKPLLEADPDLDWRPWDVNLRGTLNMTRGFLPLLLSKPHGLNTVINLSSIGALTATPGGGSYRTSKLAILRWTEVLYEDYRDQGLLAYCVHPGAVMSRLAGNTPAAMHDKLTDKPELAGATIAWLSQARQEWLGGRYVSCCWDMEELLSRRDEIVAGDKLKMRMVF
ncbi:MAG: hypothetical protein Q9162_001349 [Coniocarpon cinnabarinum]